jgi:large subunit ribosomal protein L9
MKVILLQDVKGQGKKGEVVNVSDGYARNYLFPRKIAEQATADALNTIKLKDKAKKELDDREKQKLQELAVTLQSMVVRVIAKAGENGKLFGSVTSKEISEELEKQYGIAVDKRKISLAEPIKTYGSFEVPAKLGHEVSAVIMVNVTEG